MSKQIFWNKQLYIKILNRVKKIFCLLVLIHPRYKNTSHISLRDKFSVVSESVEHNIYDNIYVLKKIEYTKFVGISLFKEC